EFANATGDWRRHDANFFAVKSGRVFDRGGSATSGAAGLAHVENLGRVWIQAHDVGIVVAVHEEFRRSGSQALPEDMEFAVAIRDVEERGSVRSPFIGPADAFVEREAFQLIERLGFRIYLRKVNGWCDVVAQKDHSFSISGDFRPRLPVRAAGKARDIPPGLAGALIHSQRPDVGL